MSCAGSCVLIVILASAAACSDPRETGASDPGDVGSTHRPFCLGHTIPFGACAGETDGGESLGVASQRDSSGWIVLPGSGDFNHDGLSDVLWGNPGVSAASVWLMSGSQLLAPGPVIRGPSGDGWSAATTADFDGDGMADVLWTDAKGKMAVWLMNGSRVRTRGPVILGPGSEGWVAANAADFNLDGMADVLWYNTGTHSMVVWLMAGAVLLQAGPVIPAPSGDGWIATNAVDFNHDGMADVLWNNAGANTISVWLMSGANLLLRGPMIPGPNGGGWSAVTAADFNLDGMADVLWTDDAKGKMAVWLMTGTQLLEPGPAVQGPGLGWTAATAGDCNGDGMADAVWNNVATDRMAVWVMTNTQLLHAGPEIPGPAGGP